MDLFGFFRGVFLKTYYYFFPRELHYVPRDNYFESNYMFKNSFIDKFTYQVPDTKITLDFFHDGVSEERLHALCDVASRTIRTYMMTPLSGSDYNDVTFCIGLFGGRYDFYDFSQAYDLGEEILGVTVSFKKVCEKELLANDDDNNLEEIIEFTDPNVADYIPKDPYVFMSLDAYNDSSEATLSHEIVHCMQSISDILHHSTPFHNANIVIEGVAEHMSHMVSPHNLYETFFNQGLFTIKNHKIDFYSLYVYGMKGDGAQVFQNYYSPYTLGTVLTKFLWENHLDILCDLYDSFSEVDYVKYHNLYNKAWEINESGEFDQWMNQQFLLINA